MSEGGESEYNRISCTQCGAVVGRVFTKTSSLNDQFLDLLCLHPDAVTSYQLGKHEMKMTGHDDTAIGDEEGARSRGLEAGAYTRPLFSSA